MTLTNHKTTTIKREIRAQSRHPHAAFTVIELLVVVIILIILVGMMIPNFSHDGAKANCIKCVNNLKNVGLAFRIFAGDNDERFPWQTGDTNGNLTIGYSADPTTYIRAVTNELSTPLIVICRDDKRKETTNWTQFTRENMSYFISPDASELLPQSFMAGDRNITNQNGTLQPGLRSLSTTNLAVGWDHTIHNNQGNACMGDGSVQQLSSARLREQLRNTGQTNTTIQLSVP